MAGLALPNEHDRCGRSSVAITFPPGLELPSIVSWISRIAPESATERQ